MPDRWAVGLALAVAAGALRPSAVPFEAAALLVVAGLVARRPVVLCLGAALLASGLAASALAGLEGVEPRSVAATVTLLTDPEADGGRVEAEARLDGRHVLLQASGPSAAGLAQRLAGEHLVARGSLAPLAAPSEWSRSRHLAGRLTVHRWSPGPPPGLPARAANGYRRTLDRGAERLGERRASLFAGLVVGDDRDQPADLADDFEGAGLVHLLAVSGQNVAFVLAVAGPLVRRLRLWPRLGVTLAVIGGFALLTRFEPSVTRAAAMAALASSTTTLGRPQPRLRVLALAVSGLLLVDPLLVRSLGFQLSVAAVTAIAVAAAPIGRTIPGPRWLAEPIGVTLAAQLGVAPLLLGAFGSLPIASVPANVLAVPAAGLVMVWGMTAGALAGLAPEPVADLLHTPTRVLLWWVEAVAGRAARAPLGHAGPVVALTVALALGSLILAVRNQRWSWLRPLGGIAVAGSMLVGLAGAHAPPGLRTALSPGVVRWHAGATDVVVLGGASWQSSVGAEATLAALRVAGVGAIDALVVVDDSVAPSMVDVVGDRHPTGAVLIASTVAPGHRPDGAAVVPPTGTALEVGDLHLLITPAGDRLVVEAWPRGP